MSDDPFWEGLARKLARLASLGEPTPVDPAQTDLLTERKEPVVFAPLAPLPVRARDTDPQPSHDAAALVDRKGTATHQGERILEALRQHPEGLTAAALDAMLFPQDRNVVACKRLPELERRGLVDRTKERRATPGGVLATIWRAQ